MINELYDYSVENDYKFYCLTSSTDEDIEDWQERTGAEYPFCLMDNITLKTMIRSNPGLMLLKNGVVINKWSVNSLPDEYMLTDRLEKLPLAQINTKDIQPQSNSGICLVYIPIAVLQYGRCCLGAIS